MPEAPVARDRRLAIGPLWRTPHAGLLTGGGEA